MYTPEYLCMEISKSIQNWTTELEILVFISFLFVVFSLPIASQNNYLDDVPEK